jgi:CubicO group peptidase (beta-lactamase class C family)
MNIIPAILLVFVCCHLPAKSCANEQDMALSQLRSDLYRLKDEYDVPAMAVIIVNPDKVLMMDISGLADRETGKAASQQTIFRIGSITKMFTSLAMLILQEDGLLDLDMNVYDITPAIPLRNEWRETHPVKISHLLEHTAGLPDLSKAEFDHNTALVLEQALQWKAADRRTYWPPGLHHSYTNVGAGLAAYIIEKVSKHTFESFMKLRIFTPLGMSSATLVHDEHTLSQLATGYDTDSHSVIPYWHTFYRAFGAINIRPIDMVPFLQLLMNKGMHGEQRLLTEESIMRMERPSSSLAAKSGLQFGYGLGNYTSLRNGLLFHGHGGDADGYLSRLGYNRDTNLGYFVVINTFQNKALSAIRHKIEDFISRNQNTVEATPYTVSEESLRLYSGVYQGVTQRFIKPGADKDALIVSVNDGKLLVKYRNSTEQLFPVNDGHFRYIDENIATSAFIIDDNNRVFFQNDDGNFQRISD